jgi:hypothetical protein
VKIKLNNCTEYEYIINFMKYNIFVKLTFIEPEGSLQGSTEPITGPYPEPDEFSHNPPTPYLQNPL